MPRAVCGSGETHKGRTANSAPDGVPQRAALRQSENPVLPFVADPRAWNHLARSTERRGHIGTGCGEVKWEVAVVAGEISISGIVPSADIHRAHKGQQSTKSGLCRLTHNLSPIAHKSDLPILDRIRPLGIGKIDVSDFTADFHYIGMVCAHVGHNDDC